MISFLNEIPIQTKKIIVCIYEIVLLLAAILIFFLMKYKIFLPFDYDLCYDNFTIAGIFLLLCNFIICFLNCCQFYSEIYPNLADFKFGYETFIGVHILFMNVYIDYKKEDKIVNVSFKSILYLIIYLILIGGNYFLEKDLIASIQSSNPSESSKKQNCINCCCSLQIIKLLLFAVDIAVAGFCVVLIIFACLLMFDRRFYEIHFMANAALIVSFFNILLLIINTAVFCIKKTRYESICYFRLGNFIIAGLIFCYQFILINRGEGFLLLFPATLFIIVYFAIEETFVTRIREQNKLTDTENIQSLIDQQPVITSINPNNNFV